MASQPANGRDLRSWWCYLSLSIRRPMYYVLQTDAMSLSAEIPAVGVGMSAKRRINITSCVNSHAREIHGEIWLCPKSRLCWFQSSSSCILPSWSNSGFVNADTKGRCSSCCCSAVCHVFTAKQTPFAWHNGSKMRQAVYHPRSSLSDSLAPDTGDQNPLLLT